MTIKMFAYERAKKFENKENVNAQPVLDILFRDWVSPSSIFWRLIGLDILPFTPERKEKVYWRIMDIPAARRVATAENRQYGEQPVQAHQLQG